MTKFKVGDVVKDRQFSSKGIITSMGDDDLYYPITVDFGGNLEFYTADGHYTGNSKEPSLILEIPSNAGPVIPDEPARALKNHIKDDKSPLQHLLLEHVDEMCRVFAHAEQKYPRQENGEPNYFLGHSYFDLLAAIMRHTLAAIGGQSHDPETGFSHIAHIMCNCAMLQAQKKRKTLRDYKEGDINAKV